jgi:uracil permease
MGDGIGTILGGLIGGMGNTTYGENVAVIGVTGVASSRVLIPSCLLAISLAFVGPLMTAVQSIPYCVFGGAALILYGFIAISGMKSLQKVDLNKNKNLLVASVILVSGIGGLVLNFGTSFTFTSTALSMILGIILNLILRDKKIQIAN